MTCPSCGKELPGEFPFCPFCGAATATAPAHTGREERKVVTVLFADLVGFTARSEQLDPEDVRALLTPYHAHLRAELERFGGTVEKFIGDAVMALFGAPAAHEDDPERAVRAALEIRDWAESHTEQLQLRIGVNTGEALIALDARPSEGEAMAAGDVVNTAARLQAAAPLNGVLVGEQTQRATAHVIDYRPAEPVIAKGKSEPVAAWQALQARSSLGVDVQKQAASPLVGRNREVDLLVSTLARVREERSPQLVTVVGVPGIGKSRLVHELLRAADQDPEFIRWRQGRSLPYGDGVTFWALAEIVKAEIGALESDTADQVEEKLRHSLQQLHVESNDAAWLERHLRPLAGLADLGETSAGEVFAAWRRFFEVLAEEQPLVLVFEDLHWADDAMLDFVDELVERAGFAPMLVLATARPELLQRRSGWGGGMSNALTISLSPLSDDDTARLIQTLLERPLVEAGTQQELLVRAGGNPLYAEQFARVLIERGTMEELPETVQGIISARLDALSSTEKQLLQDAAAVGKVFWLGAVEAIGGLSRREAEDLLHQLERKEFVQRARTSSVGRETEYVFRHLLIRDVAYGQIPRAVRCRKHQQTAAWIESLGRPEDQAEMLAHHYLRALELADAAGLDAGDFAEPARRALRAAGDRAAALYAIDAAARYYEAALRLTPPDDPGRPMLMFRRAAPASTMAGGDPAQLEEAMNALLAAGDKATAAEALVLLSRSLWQRGDREAANARTTDGLAMLSEMTPSRAKALLLAALASRSFLRGDAATSMRYATESAELAESLGWDEGLSEALTWLGNARIELGDPDGIADIERAVEIATSIGALNAAQRATNTLGVAHVTLANLHASIPATREAERIARQIGSADDLRWFRGVEIELHYREGSWSECLRYADAFLAEVEAGSPHYLTGQAYAIRALIRLGRGDTDLAVADAERAGAWGLDSPEPQVRNHLVPVSAYVLAVAGKTDRALALARTHLDELGRGVELAFAVISLPIFAAAARQLGLADELVESLDRRRVTPWVDAVRSYAAGGYVAAADLLQQIGSVPDEAEARLRAAEQLVAAGRRPEADEQLHSALAFYRSVGATRYISECEALLATPA